MSGADDIVLDNVNDDGSLGACMSPGRGREAHVLGERGDYRKATPVGVPS